MSECNDREIIVPQRKKGTHGFSSTGRGERNMFGVLWETMWWFKGEKFLVFVFRDESN